MSELNQFLADYRIGDYAGILGFFITIVGFGITIKTALNAKLAANQASLAVNSMREDLRKSETVADFSSALATMDEIKRMQRSGSLQYLPDRYSQLRRFLISIRSSNPLLSDSDQQVIQSAIAQFSSLERSVEKAIEEKGVVSAARMNALVSKQSESLQDLLIRIKSEMNEGGDL